MSQQPPKVYLISCDIYNQTKFYSKPYSFRLSLSLTLMGQSHTLDSMPIKLISTEMRQTYLKSKVGYYARSLMNFPLIMHSIYMISVPFLALRLSLQQFRCWPLLSTKNEVLMSVELKRHSWQQVFFRVFNHRQLPHKSDALTTNSIQTVQETLSSPWVCLPY